MSASSYARGNVVYAGGTTAPTRGTVDPLGYIDRSLNMGGLAQAALTRLTAPAPTNTAIMDHNSAAYKAAYAASIPKAPTPAPVHTVTDTGKLNWMNPSTIATPSSANAQVIPGQNVVDTRGTGTAASPTMENMPSMVTQQPASMGGGGDMSTPYDGVEAAGEQSAFADRNSFLNQLLRNRQSVEEDYTNQRRDAELQHPIDQRNILNSAAGRGMAFSSGYGYDVGQNENQYADLLGKLDRSHTLQLNDLTGQQTDYEGQYGAKLQELKAAAVARLAQQAGTLGLGGAGGLGQSVMWPGGSQPVPTAAVPATTPAAVAAPQAGTRAMSSFSAAAQAKLKAGQEVLGGDGRIMKLVNGVPTSQGMMVNY